MARVEIKSVKNGPNVVFLDGKVFGPMCHCRASNNKPYCDGTHVRVNFIANPAELKVLNQ